jgi:hypothetical protein
MWHLQLHGPYVLCAELFVKLLLLLQCLGCVVLFAPLSVLLGLCLVL